jgi:hypothetical protein
VGLVFSLHEDLLMAASFAMGLLMLLTFPVAGGNDLLDCIAVETYWQAKRVSITPEAMISELRVEAAADVSAFIKQLGSDEFKVREEASRRIRSLGAGVIPQLEKAAAADDQEVADRARALVKQMGGDKNAARDRRLMAIRTLGEMKHKEAFGPLKKLLDSREPFVAEYARRSLAQIEGQPPPKHTIAAKQLDDDLSLLPAGCGLVAQMSVRERIPFRLDTLLDKLPAIGWARGGGGPKKEDITKKINDGVLMLIDKVGNVRVDAATIGVADDIGPDRGFFVLVVRGQYSRDAVKQALKEAGKVAGGGVTVGVRGGIDYIAFDTQVGIFLPSDERMVFVAGAPRGTAMTLDDMAAALKAGQGKFAANEKLAALVKTVDRSKPIWAAAVIGDRYKDLIPPIKDLDSATLAIEQDGTALSGKLVLRGRGADKVETFDGMLKGGIASAMREVEQVAATMPMLKAFADMLRTIKTERAGPVLTVSARVKDSGDLLIAPFTMFPFWALRD